MIKKRLLSLALAGSMLLGVTGLAMAGIPDDTLSTASSAAGTIYIVPDGSGPTLGSVGLTVSVNVRDSNNDPIVGYPFQDMWVDDIGNGSIALCQGGSVADGNTDANGDATISGAIAGGGQTQSGMQVYLAGVALAGAALQIDANSADITGDLVVNLADIGEFGIDFNGAYNFRSDFIPDGTINLADVGELGIANGSVCP